MTSISAARAQGLRDRAQSASSLSGFRRVRYLRVPIPSKTLEYAYFASVAYSVLAEVLGVAIPLAAGGMILALAAACLWRLQSRARLIFEPIGWLLACGVSFVVIQVGIHGESLADGNMRAFINWILGLMIVHSLCLRPGFSRRFPLVLFVLGTGMLPYLTFNPGEVERARIGLQVGGSLSHVGGLAEWFGFCAVFFAIAGLQTDKGLLRTAAWVAGVGSLIVVTLTVSRGVLVATVLATVVGFRGLLKHGFVPVFVLSVVVAVVVTSGVFQQAVLHYSARGTEDTGRGRLWVAAVERIAASPLAGVGLSNVDMFVLSPTEASPPHNTFLWFALSSGIAPVVFFCGFWIQAAKRSWSARPNAGEALFRLPYLLYTFVSVMLGDSGFMSLWALLALSVGAGSCISHVFRRQSLLATIPGGPIARAIHDHHGPDRERESILSRS